MKPAAAVTGLKTGHRRVIGIMIVSGSTLCIDNHAAVVTADFN
jgi:hypothetical protein